MTDSPTSTATPTSFETPTSVPGCSMPSGLVLWLRADEGLTTNSVNEVSSWVDESGNGNNAIALPGSEPVAVPQGPNGCPVVQFDGMASYLSITNVANALVSNAANYTVEMTLDPDSTQPSAQAGAVSDWGGGQLRHLVRAECGIRELDRHGLLEPVRGADAIQRDGTDGVRVLGDGPADIPERDLGGGQRVAGIGGFASPLG